ncbi:MAG: glycosyltransferase family 4 protein [Gemmatimonadota bacterium]
MLPNAVPPSLVQSAAAQPVSNPARLHGAAASASAFDAIHLSSAHPAFDIRIFLKECRSLASAGYRVALVAQGTERGWYDGVWIEPVRTQTSRVDRMVSMSRNVWRVARRLGARLYHFHDPELIPLGLFAQRAGTAVVYDAHENLPADLLDKPWVPGFLRPGLSRVVDLGERASAGQLSAVVAATPAIGRRFVAHRCQVVQNFPILSEWPKAGGMPYAEREAAFAYVGGIGVARGAEVMIDAARLANQGRALRLDLAGRFNPAALRAALSIRPGWHLVVDHGWLDRPSVAGLLGQARAGLLVLESLANHLDSQPIKLFEYMAAGLPVIASDFPHWREIIGGADCGILVDQRSAPSVADAMTWVLDHPAEAEAMGRRGRAAVEARYNWGRESAALLGLYGELLGVPA